MKRRLFSKWRYQRYLGSLYDTDVVYQNVSSLSDLEVSKRPLRSEVINCLLGTIERPHKSYLEIGVRNPKSNFNLITADRKYGVDPGIEFEANPVDFQMTSDLFFQSVRQGLVLDKQIRFDVIFIDGLHEAEQVAKDVENSLDFIADDGFVVLHDCNPPSEYHAREDYRFDKSPAKNYWNGTTWKAFLKYRMNLQLSSACIDSDWGVGIITKRTCFNALTTNANPFYEYSVLDRHRKELLNLISFQELIAILKGETLST